MRNEIPNTPDAQKDVPESLGIRNPANPLSNRDSNRDIDETSSDENQREEDEFNVEQADDGDNVSDDDLKI